MRKTWKILFFDQKEFAEQDLIWGLLELGFEPRMGETRVPDAEYTEDVVGSIMAELGDAELVITKDFSAATAEACHRADRAYLSWVHDSPQRGLYMKEARYDTNIIFLFDRAQITRLGPLAIPHLFHAPLATNVTRVSAVQITEADRKRFAADVSFVGSLYRFPEREAYLNGLAPETASGVEKILGAKAGNWNQEQVLFHPMEPALLKALQADFAKTPPELQDFPEEYAIQTVVFARETARRERLMVLDMLSEICDVALYTSHPEKESLPAPVRVFGYADYYTDVPKIFYCSKINLNITLPSIETGVPQRVFDIMSAGGFAMCNEQAEARELFVPDKEIVLFADLDDLREKTLYYLRHESERERIAAQGYQRVGRDYSVPRVLSRMLEQTQKVFDIR